MSVLLLFNWLFLQQFSPLKKKYHSFLNLILKTIKNELTICLTFIFPKFYILFLAKNKEGFSKV